MEQNFVLSCSLCNGIKRDDLILNSGENPEDMLINKRDELVARARELIETKLKTPNNHWEQAKKVGSSGKFVGRNRAIS